MNLFLKAMKIEIIGDLREIVVKQLPKEFILDTNFPDIVLSFGGDGTFLLSEYKYPGVPKLFIKHKWDCNKCDKHDFKKMFHYVLKKKYKTIELDKLEVFVNGKKEIVCINDVNLHYIPPRAVRFSLKVNGNLIDNEVIGDGLVVSTSFGSTGYFSSITGKTFKSGFGIALNNPVQKIKLIISKSLSIEAKILRGPAVLVADCQDKKLILNDGDVLSVKPSKEKAKAIIIGKEIRFRDY